MSKSIFSIQKMSNFVSNEPLSSSMSIKKWRKVTGVFKKKNTNLSYACAGCIRMLVKKRSF